MYRDLMLMYGNLVLRSQEPCANVCGNLLLVYRDLRNLVLIYGNIVQMYRDIRNFVQNLVLVYRDLRNLMQEPCANVWEPGTNVESTMEPWTIQYL